MLKTVTFRFLEHCLAIVTDDPVLLETLAKRLAHHVDAGRAHATWEVILSPCSEQPYLRFGLHDPMSELIEPSVLAALPAKVRRMIAETALTREIAALQMASSRLLLHASAVAYETRRTEKALLLCGPAGIGKTTLSQVLSVNGAKLVCDDLCIIQPPTEAHQPALVYAIATGEGAQCRTSPIEVRAIVLLSPGPAVGVEAFYAADGPRPDWECGESSQPSVTTEPPYCVFRWSSSDSALLRRLRLRCEKAAPRPIAARYMYCRPWFAQQPVLRRLSSLRAARELLGHAVVLPTRGDRGEPSVVERVVAFAEAAPTFRLRPGPVTDTAETVLREIRNTL